MAVPINEAYVPHVYHAGVAHVARSTSGVSCEFSRNRWQQRAGPSKKEKEQRERGSDRGEEEDRENEERTREKETLKRGTRKKERAHAFDQLKATRSGNARVQQKKDEKEKGL